MKIVAKPIDMIAVFYEEKTPRPYKFRITEENGERQEVTIEKIIQVETSQLAGTKSLIYTCQSNVLDKVWTYQLKYIIERYRWELYKV